MITEIKTTYKGLNLHLKELGNINYFVGKNGSGKTRLFDAVSRYASKLGKSEVDKETKIEVSYKYILNYPFDLNTYMSRDKKKWEITDKNNPYNRLRIETPLRPGIQESLVTKTILSIFGLDKKTFKMGSLNSDEYETDNCVLFCGEGDNGETFFLEDLSSGFQSFFKVWAYFYYQFLKDIPNSSISCSITIDELDRHLHPSLTKELPKNLEIIKIGIEEFLRQKGAAEVSVQFFISTHSPFLISALRDEGLKMTHKVYMLEDGKTVEPRGRTNTEESNKGYSSEQVLLTVNKMLGVELDDLTPEVFILAEESVHVLLKSFAEKFGKECKYFQYTTHGDSDAIKMGLTLLKQRKAIPFLNSKIYTIFDGKLDSVTTQDKTELEILYVKDDTVLDLESCYPEDVVNNFIKEKGWGSWDKEKFSTFSGFLSGFVEKTSDYQNVKEIVEKENKKTTVKDIKQRTIGIIKSELARYVVENCDEQCLRHHLPVLDKIFHNK